MRLTFAKIKDGLGNDLYCQKYHKYNINKK